jgi:hypothetical protein
VREADAPRDVSMVDKATHIVTITPEGVECYIITMSCLQKE